MLTIGSSSDGAGSAGTGLGGPLLRRGRQSLELSPAFDVAPHVRHNVLEPLCDIVALIGERQLDDLDGGLGIEPHETSGDVIGILVAGLVVVRDDENSLARQRRPV